MKLRRTPLVMALVVSFAACQPASEPTFTSADEAAIEATLDTYLTTVLAGDWTGLADQYYTADAVRMPPDQPAVEGRDAIIAFAEAYPPITAHTLSPQAIVGDGDVAYARGSYTITVTTPGGESVDAVGKWYAVYERQEDGSWLCAGDIWNNDAPAEM